MTIFRKRCMAAETSPRGLHTRHVVLTVLIIPTNLMTVFHNFSWIKHVKTGNMWLQTVLFSPIFMYTALREEWLYQIGWIFGKIPNGLRPPPPLIFRKFLNMWSRFWNVTRQQSLKANVERWKIRDVEVSPSTWFNHFQSRIEFGEGTFPKIHPIC